jgi:very-short-patch-repair endonuclease
LAILLLLRQLPYKSDLKEFARYLRNNSTPGEILLWKHLQGGTMMNYSFNRQKPLGLYIVDFYCRPLNLVIEVDGSYHFEQDQMVKDNVRQQFLERMQLNFLRFEEMQVRKDMDNVLRSIEDYIINYEKTNPCANPAKRSRHKGLEGL